MNDINLPYSRPGTRESQREDRPITVKLWGTEELIVNTDCYCGKKLTVWPGFECSLHYHNIKEETFYVTEGLLDVEYWINGNERIHTVLVGWRNDSLHLMPGTPHRFSALGNEPATFFEFSSHHSDEDVVRIQPSRETTITGDTAYPL